MQRGALLPPICAAPGVSQIACPVWLSPARSKSRVREPPGEALEGPERVQEKRAEQRAPANNFGGEAEDKLLEGGGRCVEAIGLPKGEGKQYDPHAMPSLRCLSASADRQAVQPLQDALLWAGLPETALGRGRPRQAM